jgi:hypothetical protein
LRLSADKKKVDEFGFGDSNSPICVILAGGHFYMKTNGTNKKTMELYDEALEYRPH